MRFVDDEAISAAFLREMPAQEAVGSKT